MIVWLRLWNQRRIADAALQVPDPHAFERDDGEAFSRRRRRRLRVGKIIISARRRRWDVRERAGGVRDTRRDDTPRCGLLVAQVRLDHVERDAVNCEARAGRRSRTARRRRGRIKERSKSARV